MAPSLEKLALYLAVAGVMASCAGGAETDSTDWGQEAVAYQDALAAAYRDNDFYGVLDFYTPAAFVEMWRGDIEGGAVVPELLRWNAGDMGRSVEEVYLGESGSVTIVDWQDLGTRSAIVSSMDQGRVASEEIFELAEDQRKSFRSSDEIVARYEVLYREYAEASGEEIHVLHAGEGETLPAVYLGGAGFSVDPERAIGIYEREDEEGCRSGVAVLWQLDDSEIVSEEWFHETSSYARCHPDQSTGWWTGLSLPPPADQVPTGSFVTGGGQDIEIRNGVAVLETALATGFAAFADADLEEPVMDAIAFQPSRKCVDRSGRLIQDDDGRVLYVCLFEIDVCPPALATCNLTSVSTRATFLHELAHAWILDHVDSAAQSAFLDLVGLEEWQDPSAPWADQGVEYAAEVVTWGLLDEPPSMVRIGGPPCELLTDAFELLTGRPPVHDPARC